MNSDPPRETEPLRGPLRADARRNRDSILHTAARHFAAQGVNTSLEEIAREAGVGPATLYRHFPTREALLAATLMERQSEVLARADAARAIGSADDALAVWLGALQDYLCTYDGLPTPVLAAVREDTSLLALSCENLITLTAEVLARAQAEGHARATITPQDLFLSVLGAAWVVNRTKADSARKDALASIIARGYRRG